MITPKFLRIDLIDSLQADYKSPEVLIGENGLLKQPLKCWLSAHSSRDSRTSWSHKHRTVTKPIGNARNGKSRKILTGEFGELPIEIPVTIKAISSRKSFPSIKPATGLDDKLLSLYACGMAVREIQQHFTEMYGAGWAYPCLNGSNRAERESGMRNLPTNGEITNTLTTPTR